MNKYNNVNFYYLRFFIFIYILLGTIHNEFFLMHEERILF